MLGGLVPNPVETLFQRPLVAGERAVAQEQGGVRDVLSVDAVPAMLYVAIVVDEARLN